MIEWQNNDRGIAIPHVEGRPLCSKANPEREADIWVEKTLSKLYASTDAIVILGYGAGFHVRALQKKTSLKIYVVEMLEGISQSVSSSQDLTMIHLSHVSDIWSHGKIKELVSKRFQIFQHYPSTSPFLKDYDLLRHNLTARHRPAFRKHIEHTVPNAILANVDFEESKDLLSVRDISEHTTIHKTSNQKSYLWKILGELLK